MKACPLIMPDMLADYLTKHPLGREDETLAYAMMLSPLMLQGKLNRTQVAKFLQLREDEVDAIYAYYHLPYQSFEKKDGTFSDITGILTIEQIKKRVQPVFQKYRIQAAYLFGSYARGKARADSDIDIRIESGVHSKAESLFGVSRFRLDLMNVLKKDVDLLTCIPEHLQAKSFAEDILAEQVLLYEVQSSGDESE